MRVRKFFITTAAQANNSYVSQFIPRCINCQQPVCPVPEDQVNSLDEVEALQCKRTCCCLMCPRLFGDVVRGGVNMALNPCQTAKRLVKASIAIAFLMMLWPLVVLYLIAHCFLKQRQ